MAVIPKPPFAKGWSLPRPAEGAARARSWRWKLVCCGGRQEAFGAFMRALADRREHRGRPAGRCGRPGNGITLPASANARRLGPVRRAGRHVHLMIETMESLDRGRCQVALAAYYGQRFNANALPKAADLESRGKDRLSSRA